MSKRASNFTHVYREELRALEIGGAGEARPSTRYGLAGLAFSGGGIRSATFNLGVLIGLQKAGMLRHFDYLSTVSGGGYIGACLSNMVAQNTLGELVGPEPGEPATGREGQMLVHLRNHASYLVNGKWDGWISAIGYLLTGILVNLVLLMPVSLAAAGVAALITVGQAHDVVPIPFLFTLTCAGLWVAMALLLPWFSQLGGRLSRRYRALGDKLLALMLLCLVFEVQPYLLHGLHMLSWGELGAVASGMLSTYALLSTGAGDKLAALSSKLVMVVAMLIAVLLPLSLYLPIAVVAAHPPDSWAWLPPWGGGAACIAAALVLYIVLASVDVNSTSLHGFYRDRLVQAYLVHLSDGRAAHELKLSQLPARPYHLFNAIMNLQGSGDKSLRERNSDLFLFSRGFVGSERTGYVATADLEALAPGFSVGSAVAISGAAASPNMGMYTNRALVMIMGLLNVRLGYWLPNPARMTRRRPGAGFYYRELTSKLDERSAFVNVSDGGHLENEGVYQLLHRRCRFIVLGDGSADPDGQFASLAELLRLARVDLGVEIELDISAVRPHGGVSRSPCALGVIRYPARDGVAEEIGFLLYIRAALTGREDAVITNYRACNPAFPNQSTGDQFFDEAQFEAYRALGEHIVWTLTARHPACTRGVPMSRLDFQTLFPCLVVQLAAHAAPRASTLDTDELRLRIDQMLGEPAYRSYFAELFPEVADAQRTPLSAEDAARLHPVVEAQLALMERVLEDENLDRVGALEDECARGWLNLFRRYARSHAFRRAWLHLAATRSARLQLFGRGHLGLQDFMSWREHELDDDRAGPTGMPVSYVPAELLPDGDTLSGHAGAHRMRLWYSIELGPRGALGSGGAGERTFHAVIIGYALVRGDELEWLRLGAGYWGVYFVQRAISALRARWPALVIGRDVIPRQMQDWVAMDLSMLEGTNADELRAAHDDWHRCSAGGCSGGEGQEAPS